MRHVASAVAAVVLLVTATGCAHTAMAGRVAPATSSRAADIYVAVLREYLRIPAQNFSGSSVPVYVLDRTGTGDPIAPADQRRIAAAVPGVKFIADRNSVETTIDGCAQVNDGGMVMTLGRIEGDGTEVDVHVGGFRACLWGKWLTYVVRHGSGGWQVTGTTGPIAVS